MKRIIFLFAAAGLFLAVASGDVHAEAIQGYKIDASGAPFNNPGATISIFDSLGNPVGSYGPSVNPYTQSVSAGTYTVYSSTPSGYDVSYSLCITCTDHSSYTSGTQITFTVPVGGYGDLWWKYTLLLPPPPPTPSLSASAVNPSQIDLYWSNVGSGVTYHIARLDLPISNNQIYRGPSTSYSDTGLSSGTTYNYAVTACNPDWINCSPWSGWVSATTPIPHWIATGTDLSVPVPCAAMECYYPSACNNDGSCAYSPSSPGTPCTGGNCYAGSCDTSPPVTSITLNPALPNGINGWYVSSVTASVTCSDVGSGCNKITYTTDNGAHWYDASATSTPFTYNLNFGDGTYYLKAYSTDNAVQAGSTVQAPVFPIKVDASAPSVSVTGAPSVWQKADASAGVSCSDSGSGCDAATYRLKTYSSNPGSCSNIYADYTLSNPQAISSHIWVCAAAKDNAGNAGFSSPAEFLVDQIPPQVNLYGIPFSPCTLNPVNDWIDCSAIASLNSYPPEGCVDTDSGCNPASYGFIKYYSQPASCPSSKSAYSNRLMQLDNLTWVCGYAEDNVGNAGVSSPTKFMINRTFVIVVDARAYGEIDVPAGTEIKGYLCEPSQYYCNQDAQNLASSSGIVGSDGRFTITFVRELVRGTEYKVGLQTEKGYAEAEFVA